ncbi:hypothetical protein PRUPE_6G112900 [Prunus persica]|uniref:S-protein homolog n=1 Tax=Prunus persica TaxID=3760 RepID=M5W3A3_PRUPE|nr:hypothetical protein PRUPE_6G112900 [Prunus persica]
MKTINNFVIFVLFLLCQQACGWPWPWPRVTVRITNKLGGGQSMNIPCKSADNYLGLQILADDQETSWSFDPNIWQTTHFYCNVQWGNSCLHQCKYVINENHQNQRQEYPLTT